VVKIIWQQAASPPHVDGSMVFARCRQWTLHLIHASYGPSRVLISNGVSIGSAVFAQLTANSRYALQRAVPSPSPFKIAHSHGGSGSHIIHGFWAHPSPQPKWHLDRFNRLCRAHYCSRHTDDATRCNNRAHLKVRSTAMGTNNFYILNAVRCPSRTYVRNGRRGQL